MAGERSNEAVIAVEAVSAETKWREETVKTASRNNGSGFGEWASQEAAWLLAQFVKIAISVLAFRGVHQLFQSGLASERAYKQAPNLWEHGYRERGYQLGNGGPGQTGTTGKSWEAHRAGNGGAANGDGGNGYDHTGSGPENPRYVTTAGGYHLYLHRTILNPGEQFWPCPLLYKNPCGGCFFFELNASGTPQCAAVWKLKAAVEGTDGGEDLNEIREWIRNS